MAKKKKLVLKKHLKKYQKKVSKRYRNFLSRRPHRSFRLTRRRDYKRTWKVPGYWSFTNEVRSLLWSNKWLFTKFVIVYSIFSFLIIGLLSQDNYDLLSKSVNNLGGDVVAGELSGMVQNVAIFAGVMSGAFSQGLSESQQVYGGLLALLGWLTMVWLLRHIVAGNKNIKLRDGLYSSASPLVSTFLVALVVALQLVPVALALIAYGAAYSVDVFDNTLFSVLFWVVELLLIVLSTFWITSSLIALIVVTLPGMYPLKALKASSDLVIGRRLRILYRFAWLLGSIVIIWGVVLVPLIIINNLSFLQKVPMVPIVVLVLSSGTIVWASAYVYMLYRKLVSDETPAA